MSDPEETAPFTHQPYGQEPPANPFVSPSGPAAGLPPPPPPPPPPVPYGAPSPAQPYAAYAGSVSHRGATTALTLGIISIVSLLLAFACCVTIPGIFCAPFAWVTGARATREIQAQPGVYGNLAAAETGMWMGIVMTFVGAVALAGLAVLAIFVGYSGNY